MAEKIQPSEDRYTTAYVIAHEVVMQAVHTKGDLKGSTSAELAVEIGRMIYKTAMAIVSGE